jgi:hypothetical protein
LLLDLAIALNSSLNGTSQLQMSVSPMVCSCMQVRQLESDKARLMDRLEEVTGEPLGALSSPIDLLHTSLQVPVPGGDGTRKKDASLDEKKALGSIIRITSDGMARTGQTFRLSRRDVAASPQEAVAAVRRMRAERDALRKRILEILPQAVNASKYANARRELARVKHAVETMEQFLGGTNPEIPKGLAC